MVQVRPQVFKRLCKLIRLVILYVITITFLRDHARVLPTFSGENKIENFVFN